jgi:hypothetical protein
MLWHMFMVCCIIFVVMWDLDVENRGLKLYFDIGVLYALKVDLSSMTVDRGYCRLVIVPITLKCQSIPYTERPSKVPGTLKPGVIR